ncbi:MAG TPA: hypothetical protein DDY91_20425 [Planctomycetaceae bacterium]|nr:hypothetical protein [Planctomycetaceae bacterium]
MQRDKRDEYGREWLGANGESVATPETLQTRLLREAERFVHRQLDLVGGVIEEQTLRNALHRVGIAWRSAEEVLDRREFGAVYESTVHGSVRLVGQLEALEARQRSLQRRPLRVSQPCHPAQRHQHRPAASPFQRAFLALLEVGKNWVPLGDWESMQKESWAATLFEPIQVRRLSLDPEDPEWEQQLQQEAFAIRLLQNHDDALDELRALDPICVYDLEQPACRPLRYGNPYRWLRGPDGGGSAVETRNGSTLVDTWTASAL